MYAVESGMPVPPEALAYEMEAGENKDVSWGVFRPEVKAPDKPKNDKSIDKGGVMLGALYMLLDDIPGVVGFTRKGVLWWGILYTIAKTR
jgi:hypothetical protein